MKYNLASRSLYTDQGQLLKVLACPFVAQELKLQRTGPAKVNCRQCDRSVLMVHYYSEQDLQALLQKEPETCLLVDPSKIPFVSTQDRPK